jgi:hypothetical protein
MSARVRPGYYRHTLKTMKKPPHAEHGAAKVQGGDVSKGEETPNATHPKGGQVRCMSSK